MSEPDRDTDPARLKLPEFDVPEGATDKQVRAILVNALCEISENLKFLRYDAQARMGQSDANAAAIRRLELYVAGVDARVRALEQSAPLETFRDPSDPSRRGRGQ